ncbi:glucokinase [Granulicella pectinivorans]|uniref:Glucokinase n=1 Tax=Granulicella pectinivorans TaxID=474950 RepID=A0A1I6MZW3_9BACT|nr:ROK family protein [Granulicella pectinivorans]SFS21078.1 glucokinase [Granulicella pectinivorans]
MQQQLSPSYAVAQSGYVVGVDLGGTNLRLALADREGRIVGQWSTGTAGIREPAAIVTLIVGGVEELLARGAVARSELVAIAAGAPGVTDVHNGIVIVTSYLMGWRDVPLRALLEEALGVPAAVDNDVNIAALGESIDGSAKGHPDFVFLAIGSGVGAGIVLRGKVFHGMGWSAGEIGYMLVPGTSEEPVGHGKPGALESLVGGEGIKASWQAAWSAEKTALPLTLTATQVFDHAVAGDALAKTILDQAARTLAYAIYDMALILNCELFVLGGGVGMNPVLLAATEAVLAKHVAHVRPKVALSALGTDAQVIGAVRLAIETAVRTI